MSRTHRRIDDDDDDILHDGESMHVKMIDRLRRDIAAHVTDASGDSGIALHRPGFRVSDASSGAERQRAYDQYADDLTNAWKGKPPTGAGSGEFVGQRAGDICTINGAPGHLKVSKGGKLVCVPDRASDALPLRDEREVAYQQYDRTLHEAWRNAR